MQTHAEPAQFALDNPMTLYFDRLIPGSMHIDGLPWIIFLPTVVLIARAVFLLQRGQTHTDGHRHIWLPSPQFDNRHSATVGNKSSTMRYLEQVLKVIWEERIAPRG